MIRPPLVLLLAWITACDRGSGASGATSSPPSGGTPAPALQPLTNPTTPTIEGDWTGPLDAVLPATTISNSPAGELTAYGWATGDFNGDGHADLAIATTLGTEVWFGPFAPGAHLVGDAPVRVSSPDPYVYSAADLDGDGADELQIGSWFVSIPESGVFAAASIATATLVPDPGRALVTDADGDGVMDLITVGDGFAAIVYGPIIGETAIPRARDATPGTRTALLRDGSSPEYGGTPVATFSDVNGNGRPELLVSTVIGFDAVVDHVANAIWDLGDYRGLELTPSEALADDIGGFGLVGDVDGDGHPELVDENQYNLYRVADVIADAAGALPLASTDQFEGQFYVPSWTTISHACLDFSGDGRAEVMMLAQTAPGEVYAATVLDGVSVAGHIDPGVSGLRGSGCGEDLLADLDGDLVPDRAVAAGNGSVQIFSGASLRTAWAESQALP